jgi:thiamine pyrophosphokinase
VIVTGGDPPRGEHLATVLRDLPEDVLVIAADSGLDHAVRLGLTVHHAVGDFDSADPELVRLAEAHGTKVTRHPVAKDATDLELAIDAAADLGARRVVVIGGHGGRLDHLLANCLVLASPRHEALVIDAVIGDALVHVARPWATTEVHGTPGELLTLLAVHGDAEGVVTEGLAFPLRHETLGEGSTRGVSNVLERPRATVRLSAGTLLVIRPGEALDVPAHGPDPDRPTPDRPTLDRPTPDRPTRSRRT